MKYLLLLVPAFVVYTASAQISFNTGNPQLDSDLNEINAYAVSDMGSFKAEMNLSYNLTEKKFDYMHGSLQMEPGEIYLAVEISKIGKISLDNVISIYQTDKSKGWGYIAKQAGIKPGSAEFQQLKNSANSKKEKGPGKKQSQAKGNQKKK